MVKKILILTVLLVLIFNFHSTEIHSQTFIKPKKKSSIYHKGWIDLNKNGKKDPYEDPDRDIESRIDDLLSKMTMEEKTCQMATLYGFGRVAKDELPTPQWHNEIWKDGIANIDEHLNGLDRPSTKSEYTYDAGVRLPMIVNSPHLEKKGSVNHAMISFIDLVPTILDWTNTTGPDYQLPGRSFLPILNRENPDKWDEVYFSHTFHEITMYYPMRGVRTRRFKYIKNLFPELVFPFATDLFISKTWQGILKRKATTMGKRKVTEYLYRPAEELYDLESDPDEAVNVAGDAAYQQVLNEMRAKLQAMREKTEDPWLINDNYKDNLKLYEEIRSIENQ